MKKLNQSSKFHYSPVAVACLSTVVVLAPVAALAESASYGISYPTNAYTQFLLAGVPYGLDAGSYPITGLSAYDIALQSLQSVYASGSAVVNSASVVTSSGGVVVKSGGGTTTANVSSNSIFAGAIGNANKLVFSGGYTQASIDLGLLSTNKSIGSLAMQFLGSQNTSGAVEYNVRSSVSGGTIGAYYTGMDPATLAVNNNSIGASSTLNQSTTLVSGAVPLGFSEAAGGSSTITFDPVASTGSGSVSGSTTATVNINTTQGTLNGGISSGTSGGSSASLTNDLIALKSQQTGVHSENYNLTAPLSLNGNTQSASFTGNAATNVFRSLSVSGSTTNAFSGSVAVSNAQANVETLDYAAATAAMPTANVSGSKILADLTYLGVTSTEGVSNTYLTSSLSVSGTALAPQSISAQSIGNSAGSLNSAGQITASGNAIEFTNSTVNITGTNSPTGASVTVGASSGSQSANGDFVVNNFQANQRPNDSGSGVGSLVTGSSITAAVDQLAASGTVAVNYNAATAGATGNLAGNLINAQGTNVTGSMAVVSNQTNVFAEVTAQNTSSTIGAGIGMSIDPAYTVSDRNGMTAVSGSVTVDHNAIGAVGQGNLAANNLLVAATNLTAQISGGSVSNSVSSNGAVSNAGLMAINVQGNIASAVSASVSGGNVKAAFVDQAGDYQGNLAALGAATVSLSSNTISALGQGNNGGANIGVTGGTNLSLTAAAANSQDNNSGSPISAEVWDSSILATALTTAGSTITANSNAVLANANGNLGANGISVSGGTSINGAAGVPTLNLQSLQGNSGSITAATTGTAVGVRVGAASVNSYTPSASPSDNGLYATSGGGVFSDSASSSTGALTPSFTGKDITTVNNSTMAVNASRVGASASGNNVDNNVLLSGTNLGGSLPVGARIVTTQNNAGAVDSNVYSTDIGVQLENQSNSVSNSGTYSSTATTSNVYHYMGNEEPTNLNHYVAENLSTATAVASSTVTLTEAGSIKGINNSTLSVSGSQVAASSEGNAATNALQVNGTAVTLLGSSSALNIANTQLNSNAGGIGSYLDGANIGVKVGDVSGSSTAALSNRATATVASNSGGADSTVGTGIYSGSATATVTSSAAGTFTATGIDSLTSKVDASRVSATSTANAADNRLTLGATALTSTAMPNVVINNSQSNSAAVHAIDGGEGNINLGVMLGAVSATQTATANGAGANSTVTSTNNPGDSNATPSNAYLSSTATFGASGGAVATGINAGSSSVQGNSVLATATGNTVGNTINLGSTAASALSAKIDNASANPGQYNNGSIDAAVEFVALGNVVAGTTASNTSTATPQAFGTATATDTTYATASGAATASGTASSTASATGLIGAHTTTSANTLQATGYGNQASNLISGNGTTLNAVANQPAASVANQQFNDTAASMTANFGFALLGDIVGDVLASGSATAGTGSGTSRIIGSGSSTASTTLAENVAQFASAAFTSNASGSATATQTATGISGLISAVEGNSLQAGNYGNKASNGISLASTTLAGSSGTATLANVSAQNNAGGLSASVGNVDLGVVLASTTASGGATASVLADATATSNSAFTTPGGGAPQVNESLVSSTTNATGWAYASGSSSATGITGSTAGINANLLGAANYANSASNSIALTGTTVSGVSGQTTASGSNTQTNSASLGASVSGVSVGVTAGAVNADFSASADATASAASPRHATVGADSSITATQSFTVTFNAYHEVWDETANGGLGAYVSVVDSTANSTNAGNAGYVDYAKGTPSCSNGVCTVTFTANSTTTPSPSTSNFVGSTSVSGVTGNYPGGSAYAYNNTWVTPNTQAAGYGSASSSATANAYATATAIGITGSTLKVQSNQLSAINFANSADNTATLTGTVLGTAASPVTVAQTNNQTNTGSGSATASNIQLGVVLGAVTANANATANASASVGSGSGWSESTNSQADSYAYGIVGSNITVGGTASAPQKVLAESVGNSATNAITATNTTGTGASSSTTLSVGNTQINSGGGVLAATVGATGSGAPNVTVGVQLGAVSATSASSATSSDWNEYATAVGMSGSTVAVESNQLTALTYANSANNGITATTSNTLAGSSAGTPTFQTSNTQTNLATTTSNVARVDVGAVLGNVSADAYDTESATSITSSTLNISSNVLTAASYGNGANNAAKVTAQSPGTAALPLSATVISTQSNDGSQTALVDQARVGVFTGTTGIASPSTSQGASTAIAGSTLTVGHNQLEAVTYGNSVANSNSLTAANTGYIGNLVTSNTQNNGAVGPSTISNSTVGVSVGAVSGYNSVGITGTPTTVQANALDALSYGNYASNATSASGGDALYSGTGVTGANLQTINDQINAAAMTSTVNAVNVGVAVAAVTGGGSATGMTGSALTVSSNLIKALGDGNLAINSVALSDAIGALTGSVGNTQDNSSAVTSTVGTTSGSTPNVYVGVSTSTVSGSHTVAGISGGSVAVQSNALSALTYANSATNSLNSTSSNAVAGSAVGSNTFQVASLQTNTAGTTSNLGNVEVGTVLGNVSTSSVPSGTATSISASPQTVNSNTLTAGSYGNGASNTLSVTAQLPGTAAAPLSTSVSGSQSNSGAQTSLITQANIGVLTGTTRASDDVATSIAGSALTINGNVLDAASYGNNVSNANSVTAGNNGYLGLLATGNTQNNYSGASGSSTISSTTVGVSGGTVTGGSSSFLSSSPTNVSSNTLTAESYANYASNATSASGGNVLYGTASASDKELQTVNTQNNYASMAASGTALSVGVFTGSAATGVSASALTVDHNLLAAQADGNVAGNSTTLSGQQMGAVGYELSTSVGNTQNNSGSQTATLSTPRVGVFTGATTTAGLSSLSGGSVSNNTLKAMTYANSATNSDTSTASNTAYLGTMSVTNGQTNTAAGTGRGSITTATVGVDIGNSATGITGSALSVNANALTAASYGNGADNTLSVNAQTAGTSALAVNTTLGNTQDNSGSMTASIGSTTRIGVFNGTAATGITGSPLAVDDNQLQALSYGNSATNANSVKASNNAYLGTLATTNTQTNAATATGMSSISDTMVGVSGGNVSVTFLTTSPTSVSANGLVAWSYGNSASNSTSASGGNVLYGTASTSDKELATANVQNNDASTTASGSAISVGVFTGTANTGISSSALTVDGNRLVLQANGNVAGNSTALSGQQLGAVGSELSTTVTSEQTNEGGQTATLTTPRVGVFVSATSGALTGLSSLSGGSVSDNVLKAMTYANSAVNTDSTTASNTAYLGTMSTTNLQSNSSAGSGNSKISAATVGVNLSTSQTAIASSPLSVNANALTSASYGNGADNTVSVNAQTVATSALAVTTTLGNTQDNSGSMTASIEASTRVGIFTGASTGNGIASSALAVNDNQLQALTYANSATNANSVKASNDGYLGALGTTNTQSNVASGSGSSTISATTVGVSLGAAGASSTALGSSPTSVSSNDLIAASYGNYASNTTGASGGNTLYGSGATQELATVNDQTNNAAMTASGSSLLVGVLTSTAATGVSSSALTVDANTVKAEAKGNIAINTTSVVAQQTDSTTALSASGGNTQMNTGALYATVGSTTRVGVFNGATSVNSITGSATSVSSNQLQALTQANSATNSTTVATSNTADLGALATTNTQTNTSAGTGSSTVTGATVGASLGAVTGTTVTALDASPTSVSSNTLSAASYGNGASNTLSVTAQLAGISARPLGDTLTSTQNNSGSQTALMSSTNVGVLTAATSGSSSATAINASALTVSSNVLEAMTYANSAANISSVTAANSAYLGALLTSNTQNNGALGSGSSTISGAMVGVSLGNTTTLGLNNSPTSVLSNSLTAASYGNYATSATSASGGNVLYGSNNANVDLKTDNIQTNAAAMSASGSSITVGVLTTGTSGGGISNSATTVGSNAVSALSYGNQAGNSVSATAGDAIYGSGSTTALVQSVQTNSGVGSSSLDTVKVGVFTTNSGIDVSGSAVTVDSNRLTSASYANSAVNSLNLNAPILGASGTVVTGQVSNTQSNTASGSGTITDATVGVVPSTGVTGALMLNGVNGMVGNNALNAQAGGNTAINALNATAVASIAGNGPASATNAANFQVLNAQTNSSTGVMTASVSNGTIGNWGSNASNYYGPSTLTVSLNSASANAYGNSASNSLNMSALTGSSNAATAAIGNSQSNSAGLSATVTNTLIGVGTGQGTGTVAVSGNSIAANVVGNAVSNSIGVKR